MKWREIREELRQIQALCLERRADIDAWNCLPNVTPKDLAGTVLMAQMAAEAMDACDRQDGRVLDDLLSRMDRHWEREAPGA